MSPRLDSCWEFFLFFLLTHLFQDVSFISYFDSKTTDFFSLFFFPSVIKTFPIPDVPGGETDAGFGRGGTVNKNGHFLYRMLTARVIAEYRLPVAL